MKMLRKMHSQFVFSACRFLNTKDPQCQVEEASSDCVMECVMEPFSLHQDGCQKSEQVLVSPASIEIGSIVA